jgi:hypothetical protein
MGRPRSRPERAGPPTRVAAPAVCLLAMVVCAGCAGPTSTDGDYRLKAGQSATDLTAVVGSAELAARQYLAGKLPQAYADTVISRAEQDGSSIQTAFDTRQPPDSAADKVRSQLDGPVQEILGDLTDLRVAVRMDDRSQMNLALHQLAAPMGQLNHLQDTL